MQSIIFGRIVPDTYFPQHLWLVVSQHSALSVVCYVVLRGISYFYS